MERIFNGIWRVKRPREMLRQATDYFAAMLVCSLLLSLASSASVVVNTRLLGKLLLLLQKLPFLQADDASLYFESGLILALPLLTLVLARITLCPSPCCMATPMPPALMVAPLRALPRYPADAVPTWFQKVGSKRKVQAGCGGRGW